MKRYWAKLLIAVLSLSLAFSSVPVNSFASEMEAFEYDMENLENDTEIFEDDPEAFVDEPDEQNAPNESNDSYAPNDSDESLDSTEALSDDKEDIPDDVEVFPGDADTSADDLLICEDDEDQPASVSEMTGDSLNLIENETAVPAGVMGIDGISAEVFASDIECWLVPPDARKNRDVLVLETSSGANCLPETVPAKLFEVSLYEADPYGYVAEIIESEYVVDYVTDGQGNVLDGEFYYCTPDLYTVFASVVLPPGYIKSTNPYYARSLSFYFIITVTVPEPDLCFGYYKMGAAYAEAGSSPNDWDLRDGVSCYIWDRHFSLPTRDLGTLSIIWDLDNIVIEEPGMNANGEYEATVNGVIVIPDGVDLDGVDGIRDTRTVPVEIYVIVRTSEQLFGFERPIKNSPNPDFRYDVYCKPYVLFWMNFIYKGWGSDFSIWLTDDDGKTFTDVRNSESVEVIASDEYEGYEGISAQVSFYNLEYNKWYGVCLELRGDYPYAGTTETIYFMFTEEDILVKEPSGGDRNGDGRWPFQSGSRSENTSTENNEPEDNANGGNSGNGSNNYGGNNSGGSNKIQQSGNSSATSGGSLSGNSLLAKESQGSSGSSTGSVSGRRLEALMTVYPKNVPFVSNGSQLQIPTDFLKSLGLSQDSSFSVRVSEVNKNSFSIQINVDGKATDYVGQQPYTVRISYTPAKGSDGSNLLILDSKGNIQPFSYYDSRGYLVLKTDRLGTFLIIEGKPVIFSDYKNVYLDFLSARGIIAGTPEQKFNPSGTAKQSELHAILAKLPGGIQPAKGPTYPQTDLTYSVAVDLLKNYAGQIGVDVDRKDLLLMLSINENAVLSRYGCIKLAAEFMKKL